MNATTDQTKDDAIRHADAHGVRLYVRCHQCPERHEATYDHEGDFNQGPVVAVVCSDDLTDYYTREVVELERRVHTYVAEFATSRDADAYAEKLRSNMAGNYVLEVTHRQGRRAVTWTTTHEDAPGTSYYETYFYSMLEQVGAYGSSQNRKATLSVDGGTPRKAPIEY